MKMTAEPVPMTSTATATAESTGIPALVEVRGMDKVPYPKGANGNVGR